MRGVGCTREVAERKVLRVLEDRWSDSLPDGRIPRGMVKQLRSRLRFQRWVSAVMRGGGVVLPDLDVAVSVFRRPDGSLVDLMQLELGDDPGRWFCPDCGEEQDRPNVKMCVACRDWHGSGVAL